MLCMQTIMRIKFSKMTQMSNMPKLTFWKKSKSYFDCFVYLQNRNKPCKYRVNSYITGPLIQDSAYNRIYLSGSSTYTRWRGRLCPIRTYSLDSLSRLVYSGTVVTPSPTSLVGYYRLPPTILSFLHNLFLIIDPHTMTETNRRFATPILDIRSSRTFYMSYTGPQ